MSRGRPWPLPRRAVLWLSQEARFEKSGEQRCGVRGEVAFPRLSRAVSALTKSMRLEF